MFALMLTCLLMHSQQKQQVSNNGCIMAMNLTLNEYISLIFYQLLAAADFHCWKNYWVHSGVCALCNTKSNLCQNNSRFFARTCLKHFVSFFLPFFQCFSPPSSAESLISPEFLSLDWDFSRTLENLDFKAAWLRTVRIMWVAVPSLSSSSSC